MRKTAVSQNTIKLIITLALLLSAATVVIMSTYAWLVLSSNPVLQEISMAIAGGDTILIAPDCSGLADDGTTVHYPGKFSPHLDISSDENYRYLNSVGGLVPVSTADGIHWYYPRYNGPDNTAGTARIKGYAEDAVLAQANLEAGNTRAIEKGHYIYIDFWVVSPVSDYILRVSAEPGASGTFALSMPEPAADADGKYVLNGENQYAEASLRVGFLTNSDNVSDNAMHHYMNSKDYSDSYLSMKGVFAERGKETDKQYRFTIFEPNADFHPGQTALEGGYVNTYPLSDINGNGQDISDRLTVQLRSRWKETLFQSFEAITQNKKSLDEIRNVFASGIVGQRSNFVSSGAFVKKTSLLYALRDDNGFVSAGQLNEQIKSAGATEDVSIVKLEKQVPQKIRMFVWLEGQDIDCGNSAGGASVSINIELAGSNS